MQKTACAGKIWFSHKLAYYVNNSGFYVSNSGKSIFFDFESSDRSDTAYYASIKWVEAFAKDRMSKFFLKEVKKYIIDNFLWPSTKELSLLG